MSADKYKISLVVPVFNESRSIASLIQTINEQTRLPDEIVIVDGGSTDNTVSIITKMAAGNKRYKVIEAGRAMPGKARNIGAAAASHDWLVFTDAGITLEKDWLQQLVDVALSNPSASIVYGNFSPDTRRFFDKCAMISYVPPAVPDSIRTKAIVSCLLKKEVWETIGGFPDLRAAEDLIFMQKAEKAGYQYTIATDAMVYWQLRPGLASTYKKFDLYSMHNVWAGRQAYWHYGVARQYVLVLLFVLFAIFHSWHWLLMIPVWMAARAVKRIIQHRYQLGSSAVFNPSIIATVVLINQVIDIATFTGWIKAIVRKGKPEYASSKE